jgi:hypothetical protein
MRLSREVAREAAILSLSIPIRSRPMFQDDFAGCSGMISLGYRVRSFGFLHGGADASREDANAPLPRNASFEDRRGWDNEIARHVRVAPSTVR